MEDVQGFMPDSDLKDEVIEEGTDDENELFWESKFKIWIFLCTTVGYKKNQREPHVSKKITEPQIS